jgi:hypothetical protein
MFWEGNYKKNVRVGTSKTRTRNTSQRQRKQNNDNAPGPSCNLKKLGDGLGREHIRKFKHVRGHMFGTIRWKSQATGKGGADVCKQK